MHSEIEAKNKILLEKLNNNKHFVEVIKPIIETSKFKEVLGESSYPSLALAGGSLTSIWMDAPVNDWDLYFVDLTLSSHPRYRQFALSYILKLIGKKYPLSIVKLHKDTSKNVDKIESYPITDDFESTNLLSNCGLISLEIFLNKVEFINVQIIILNFKSIESIFPPENPTQYFNTTYPLPSEFFTKESFSLVNYNLIGKNSKKISSELNLNEDFHRVFFLFFKHCLKNFLNPDSDRYHNINSPYSFGYIYHYLENINRILLSPWSLIQTYDFTCVSAYYYNDEVNCVDSFYSDNESKTLVINPYHSNILNFHIRVKKYSDRGYCIDNTLLLNTLNKQYHLLTNDYNSCTKCSIIPISYFRKGKFVEEVKSILDNFNNFEVNRKMEYFL